LSRERTDLYKWAYALALITIFYNILEGLVSVFFGLKDETISLFGFGVDSFAEVISGIGIWHMVCRIREGSNSSPDTFERRALRITGMAFYLFTGGLLLTAVFSLLHGHTPVTAFWGIIVSVVSILTMWVLIHFKMKVGRGLNSPAILADAACTRICIYLSIVLFFASVGYEFTGIGGLDAAGAVLIAGLSFREGREAFEKAAWNSDCDYQCCN
jgi:hypothetical protein